MTYIKAGWILIILLSTISSSYAKNKDWTDIENCEALSNKLSQSSFAPLFNQNITVTLQAKKLTPDTNPTRKRKSYSPNCFVDITLKEKSGTHFLGNISLYHQENAHQIFIDNRKNFPSAKDINLFPWVTEGFYYFKQGNPYQEYNAYTKNGDYIIISFDYTLLQNIPFKNQQPSETEIDNRFMTFINIIGSKLIY